MTKEHISATVDPEVADYLDREGINKSGKINNLVKQEMNAGTSEKQMLKLRLEQLEGDIQDLKGRLETKQEMREDVEERLQQLTQEEQEKRAERWEDVKDRVSLVKYASMDKPLLDATEDELEEWSEKLEMGPEELKDRLKTELMEEDNA